MPRSRAEPEVELPEPLREWQPPSFLSQRVNLCRTRGVIARMHTLEEAGHNDACNRDASPRMRP